MKPDRHLFLNLLFLTVLCTVGFLLFLPYLADTYLLPRVIKNLPFSEKNLSLSRISLWKVRGTAYFSENGEQILSLPGIEFNFSPRSLLNGKIYSILIDGGTLHLNLDRIGQNKSAGKQQATKEHPAGYPFLLPIACDTVVIKNSSIVIRRGQTEHHFAINAHLAANYKELESGKKRVTSAAAEFLTTGALPLSVTATLQPGDTEHELLFSASSPDISNITYLFPEFKKHTPQGQLDLSGSLRIKDLRRIPELEATAYLSNFTSLLGAAVLSSAAPKKPLTITVKQKEGKVYSEIKNLALAGPQQGSVELRGEYSLGSSAFSGTGQINVKTIPVQLSFAYSGNQNGPETQLVFSSLTDSFSIGETSSLLVNPLSTDGKITVRDGNISGTIQASTERMRFPSGKTEFQDIHLDFPLHFPSGDSRSSAGTFRIGSIIYDTTPGGAVDGEIRLNAAGIAFSAHIMSTFGPDLQARCAGTLGMNLQTDLACYLPKTTINSASFPPSLDLPPEFSIDGVLSAEARFSSSDKITGGNLQLQFNDGTLRISENRISSIDIAVTFPELPLLRSEPSQLCTIGSIELGKIRLSDAKVFFHLENSQSIFIEKSTFAWCDGKVESGGFRLLTTEQKLETTFYCDRLNFTQLLSQFGIKDTEGEGSLNGRLPLVLSKKTITFDDGFLYTTPGDTGIVHFNNTSQLRQGMGAIDQTPNLDYTMQALENFSYNWVKLAFESEEDDLLIKMQIDGKPAEPLPFGYQKGDIIASKKGPGLQRPILLDVNFRLPIAHLFQYSKNMQSIMENM